jgi:hypothetical protein
MLMSTWRQTERLRTYVTVKVGVEHARGQVEWRWDDGLKISEIRSSQPSNLKAHRVDIFLESDTVRREKVD